jgi:hypothetical protein
VRAPLSVLSATIDLLTNSPDAFRFDPAKSRIGTSVYGMTPGSPFITAIAPLPSHHCQLHRELPLTR